MSVQGQIDELLARLLDAWNRRDAVAFAALFVEDADYVTGDGLWLQGRAAIEGLVQGSDPMGQASFQGRPSIRVSDGAGSATFRWAASGGHTSSRGVTTCVLTMTGGGWLIERLHNTDERAE